MENKNLIAHADILINASIDKVWDAFVNPDTIKKYMFGATVVSDWKKGSAISWKGEFKGKSYEDKGIILAISPGNKLQYTHFSPLAGLPDKPENYHTVTIELTRQEKQVKVALSQDNNKTEKDQEHSEKNWGAMLEGVKKLLE